MSAQLINKQLILTADDLQDEVERIMNMPQKQHKKPNPTSVVEGKMCKVNKFIEHPTQNNFISQKDTYSNTQFEDTIR